MFCDYDRPNYRVYSYLCNIKLRIRMKRLKLGIALVIVVALGVWVASRRAADLWRRRTIVS